MKSIESRGLVGLALNLRHLRAAPSLLGPLEPPRPRIERGQCPSQTTQILGFLLVILSRQTRRHRRSLGRLLFVPKLRLRLRLRLGLGLRLRLRLRLRRIIRHGLRRATPLLGRLRTLRIKRRQSRQRSCRKQRNRHTHRSRRPDVLARGLSRCLVIQSRRPRQSVRDLGRLLLADARSLGCSIAEGGRTLFIRSRRTRRPIRATSRPLLVPGTQLRHSTQGGTELPLIPKPRSRHPTRNTLSPLLIPRSRTQLRHPDHVRAGLLRIPKPRPRHATRNTSSSLLIPRTQLRHPRHSTRLPLIPKPRSRHATRNTPSPLLVPRTRTQLRHPGHVSAGLLRSPKPRSRCAIHDTSRPLLTPSARLRPSPRIARRTLLIFPRSRTAGFIRILWGSWITRSRWLQLAGWVSVVRVRCGRWWLRRSCAWQARHAGHLLPAHRPGAELASAAPIRAQLVLTGAILPRSSAQPNVILPRIARPRFARPDSALPRRPRLILSQCTELELLRRVKSMVARLSRSDIPLHPRPALGRQRPRLALSRRPCPSPPAEFRPAGIPAWF